MTPDEWLRETEQCFEGPPKGSVEIYVDLVTTYTKAVVLYHQQPEYAAGWAGEAARWAWRLYEWHRLWASQPGTLAVDGWGRIARQWAEQKVAT